MTNLIEVIDKVKPLIPIWGELEPINVDELVEAWKILDVDIMPFYDPNKHKNYTGFARLDSKHDKYIVYIEEGKVQFKENNFTLNPAYSGPVSVFTFLSGREALECYTNITSPEETNCVFRRGQYEFSDGKNNLSVEMRQFCKPNIAYSLRVFKEPNDTLFYGKSRLSEEVYPRTGYWNSFLSKRNDIDSNITLAELLKLMNTRNKLKDLDLTSYVLTDKVIPFNVLLHNEGLIREYPGENYL